jgi:hypothetical protein
LNERFLLPDGAVWLFRQERLINDLSYQDKIMRLMQTFCN